MNWEPLLAEFAEVWGTRRWGAEVHCLRGLATRTFASASHDQRQWLADALADEKLKWFAVFVLTCTGQLPHRFLEPMLRAAVYEPNPSINRTFVDPCLNSAGVRPVVTRLLDYLVHGTDFEKAGAANALYWAWGIPRPPGTEDPPALDDLRARQRELLLREFVNNPSPDVRRSIIGKLSLNQNDYPPELKPLVTDAIRSAETDGDEYIRHRLAIQLGGDGPLMPLPHREGEP